MPLERWRRRRRKQQQQKDFICTNCWQNQQIKPTNGKFAPFSICRHYLPVLSTVLQMKKLHIFHLQALFAGPVNGSCKWNICTFSICRRYLLVLSTFPANRKCTHFPFTGIVCCFCSQFVQMKYIFSFFFLHFSFAGFICWLCQQFLQMKSLKNVFMYIICWLLRCSLCLICSHGMCSCLGCNDCSRMCACLPTLWCWR